jgi:hypothetical protein
MRRKVYIIHSLGDEGTAYAVHRSLEDGGIKPSVSMSVNPQDAERAAAKLIKDSDLIVLILSSAANDSARVKREVERAVKADKLIIPFRLDTTPLPKYLEFYLSTAHWLDASTPRLDHHLTQLVSNTRRLMGLEEGYASLAASLPGQRPAKKAIVATILGAISLLVFGIILGLLAIILGVIELRAIAAGRSSIVGRKYARYGVILGGIGIVLAVIMTFLFWYFDLDPYEMLRDMFAPSPQPGPPGLR